MRLYLTYDQVPTVGQKIALPGSTMNYEMIRQSDTRLALIRNGEFIAFAAYPSRSKSGHPRPACRTVLDFNHVTFNVWLAPLPDAYKCPVRTAMAKAWVAQKVLRYADEFSVFSRVVPDELGLEQYVGQHVIVCGEWEQTSKEEFGPNAWRTTLQGGTAAIVYREPEQTAAIEQIVINPNDLEEGIKWVVKMLAARER